MSCATYISTRGGHKPLTFLQATLTGQAEDGGLLLPAHLPDISGRLEDWRGLAYQSLCRALMAAFVDDVPEADLGALIDRSYADFNTDEVGNPAPLIPVSDRQVLELFHGPTLAFKDFGLQFLGNVFEYAISRQQAATLNVLCATSGDTGSAAIAGLKGKKHIRVFVLHPAGRVSKRQRLQMTTVLDENVHNIAVAGSFDDCQSIVKDIFSEHVFKQKHNLGAVNSINWARVLAQIVYYFHAYFQATKTAGEPVIFSIPTGNFGNILAGYLAARMGLPISKLILATNENNILATFFNQGKYQRGCVRYTLSPSMDIQVASNLERYLFSYFAGDPQKVIGFMRQFNEQGIASVTNGTPVDPLITACSVDDKTTLATMEAVYRQSGYRLDPHTAVGFKAAQILAPAPEMPVICLATAHPAKFPEATGDEKPNHPTLMQLESLPERYVELPADQQSVMAYISGQTDDN